MSAATALKILFVDDFSTMRRIIRNSLHELGYEDVVDVDDGSAALPSLRRGGFDFLITDWNLPGVDGMELLKALRNDPYLADLPVLMVTAEAKREQIVAGVKAGVKGYIVKPFTAETLKDKIDRIFERPRAA